MEAIIELISERSPTPIGTWPECAQDALPASIQRIQFKIERGYSEKKRPARCYAGISLNYGGQWCFCQLAANNIGQLRGKLRIFLRAIHRFEQEQRSAQA